MRQKLFRNLLDALCAPASTISVHERHMIGEMFMVILREASRPVRKGAARRILQLADPPPVILLFLARDNIDVAQEVLAECRSLTDSMLIYIIRKVSLAHRKVIAQRVQISDTVVDALVEFLEEEVIELLLRNSGAHFSEKALQRVVLASQAHPVYVDLLVVRPELQPFYAWTIFWWAGHKARASLLKRFAVNRSALQKYGLTVREIRQINDSGDPLTNKIVHFLDWPPQAKPFSVISGAKTPEDVIEIVFKQGFSSELLEDISVLTALNLITCVVIFNDKGGEALAVFCKAKGISRKHMLILWRVLRQKESEKCADFKACMTQYDSLSTEKALTVLWFWDWAFCEAENPALHDFIEKKILPNIEDYSTAAMIAVLVFGQ